MTIPEKLDLIRSHYRFFTKFARTWKIDPNRVHDWHKGKKPPSHQAEAFINAVLEVIRLKSEISSLQQEVKILRLQVAEKSAEKSVLKF